MGAATAALATAAVAPAAAVPAAVRPTASSAGALSCAVRYAALGSPASGRVTGRATGYAARLGVTVRVTAGAGVSGLGHAHRRACPDGTGTAASSAEPATEPTRSSGQ